MTDPSNSETELKFKSSEKENALQVFGSNSQSINFIHSYQNSYLVLEIDPNNQNQIAANS